jgi:hypothetical protein
MQAPKKRASGRVLDLEEAFDVRLLGVMPLSLASFTRLPGG